MTDESIFAAALDFLSVEERASYLSAACDTPAQRARLETLLAAHDRAGSFLGRPAVAAESDGDVTHTTAPDDAATRAVEPLSGDPPDEADAVSFLAPPGRADSLGRIGHYEVLEVLGRGGFGIVYRAFDDILQRVVAVKVLAPHMAATSPARKRFLREARSAALVQHEHVVRIHETGEAPLPYLVMEFVPGETLQQRMDRTGPLEVGEAMKFGRQIAFGLAAAHDKGLIHRDIKPSNVLIDAGPQQAKITDFGLARAADDASLTRSGAVAGTPMYMAPEQARGEALDQRADLFSLGSVLYAMLTGRPPFRAANTPAVLKRVAEDDPRPIREIMPEVPEWLCRIVGKLHAKNPDERFQTAREVADLLADCERQLTERKELTDFTRIPGGKPVVRRPRRAWKWAAAGVGLVLAVAGIAYVWPFVRGHVNDEGKVTYFMDENSLLVRRGGELVATLSPAHPSVYLAAGEYELEGVCAEGYEPDGYVAGTRRLFKDPDRGQGSSRPVFKLTVERGDVMRVGFSVRKRAAPPPSADGFTPLFNGKDLSGWKEFPDQPVEWKVEDGVLVGRGRTVSHLFSEREYGDFHLRAQVKVNASGDSGVWFRTPFALPKVSKITGLKYPGGFEAQIYCKPGGDEDGKYTGSLGKEAAVRTALHPPDVWFDLEVIARGDTVTTLVNGKKAAELRLTAADPRRGHLALQTCGSNRPTTVSFRTIEIKELPASAPAVPTTAADVLPFLAGTWKAEWKELNPNLPPDQASGTGHVAYDFVAGGQFLRTRSSLGRRGDEAVLVYAPDPGKNSLRVWQARSTGHTSGPSTTAFNPDSRTLTWTYLNDGAATSSHQFTFVDANTVAVKLYHLGGQQNMTHVADIKLTRVQEPVAIRDLPLDPTRPAEMKVLDRLAGEWSVESTATAPADNANPKARTQAVPILGGRFVEQVITYEPSNQNDYALVWFDPAVNKYRQWVYRYPGNVLDFTGTWDEGAKTLTWQSPDKRFEGRTVFKGDDLHDFQQFVRDGAGEMRLTRAGMARRVKPAESTARVTPADGWVALLPLADLTRDHVPDTLVNAPQGKFTRSGEEVEATRGDEPGNVARLRLPLVFAGDYEVEARFTRTAGNGHLTLELPVGAKRASLYLGVHTDISYVGGIDGKPPEENPTKVPFAIKSDHKYILRVRVTATDTEASIATTLDGQPHVVWKGRPAAVNDMSGHPRAYMIDLGVAPGSTYRFHDLRLRMLTGDAKLTRPADKGKLTPPPDPKPVVLRKFDPAKDKPAPVWADAKPVTVEDGAWRVENDTNKGNFKVHFDTLADDVPKDGLIVFRAKVKVKANDKLAWGSIQLGVGDPAFHKYDWPDHLGTYRGEVPEWTAKEVRYPARVFHQKTPPSIPVYVGLNGAGVVWVKDAEVLHMPDGAKPPRASKEAVKLRAFDPTTDKLVFGPNSDVKGVTVEDGGWRIESGTTGVKGFHVTYGSIVDDVPSAGLIVLRMRVKTKANDKLSWGSLTLNNTDPSFHKYDWPKHLGEYRGDVPEWTPKEIRIPAAVFHKKNPPTLTASADFSDGVLWVKDVEVWHVPEGAKLDVLKAAPAEQKEK